MSEPREFKYSADIVVWAISEDDASEQLDDCLSFSEIELGCLAPFSTNPTSTECTNCPNDVWADEVESCSKCGAELCGDCLVKFDGICQYCAEDDE